MTTSNSDKRNSLNGYNEKENVIKLMKNSNQERMLFSSISHWILKFLVLFWVLSQCKATVILQLLLMKDVFLWWKWRSIRMQIFPCTLHTCLSVTPSLPFKQLHVKLLIPSTKEPPFWQVWFTQSLLFIELIRINLFLYKTEQKKRVMKEAG